MNTEASWAAGFFDGEGNIRCAHRDGMRAELCLQISQIDPFVLERFKLVVGVGNVRGPYKSKHRDVFKFSCSNDDAIAAFEIIKPHLSVPKLVQGENAKLEYQRKRYRKP